MPQTGEGLPPLVRPPNPARARATGARTAIAATLAGTCPVGMPRGGEAPLVRVGRTA